MSDHPDAEGVWHATCAWCGAAVVSMVGPPHMARVTGQAMSGEPVSEWDVDLECYTNLIKLIDAIQRASEVSISTLQKPTTTHTTHHTS